MSCPADANNYGSPQRIRTAACQLIHLHALWQLPVSFSRYSSGPEPQVTITSLGGTLLSLGLRRRSKKPLLLMTMAFVLSTLHQAISALSGAPPFPDHVYLITASTRNPIWPKWAGQGAQSSKCLDWSGVWCLVCVCPVACDYAPKLSLVQKAPLIRNQGTRGVERPHDDIIDLERKHMPKL